MVHILSVKKNIDDGDDIKRVFFHRKQYFIVQYEDDKFVSYELMFSEDMKTLILFDNVNEYFRLGFQYDDSKQELMLSGILSDRYVSISAKKESLLELPLFDNKVTWTFD